MNRRPLSLLLLAALVALPLAGCAKKKAPVTTPTAAPVAAEVRAPEPAPEPVPADPVASPLDGELVEANAHAYRTGLLGDVYFDYDLASLRQDARDRLAKNAEFLRSRPEFTVMIEGHCDERGTNEYNLALGERRASAAKDYIVSLGVSAIRLRTISYGEERPQCRTSDESCWALNRRAHFMITGRTNVG